MVSVPPLGMASRAFTTRFISTCSIWPGSALTHAEVRPQHEVQIDILADQPPQHGAQAVTSIQVQHPGLQHLPPAEGQQLLGQRGGTLPGLQDLFRRMVVRIVRLQGSSRMSWL